MLQATSWVTAGEWERGNSYPTIQPCSGRRVGAGVGFGVTTGALFGTGQKSAEIGNYRLLNYLMMIGISRDLFKFNRFANLPILLTSLAWLLNIFLETFESWKLSEGGGGIAAHRRNTFISYSWQIIFYFLKPKPKPKKSQKQKRFLGAN